MNNVNFGEFWVLVKEVDDAIDRFDNFEYFDSQPEQLEEWNKILDDVDKTAEALFTFCKTTEYDPYHTRDVVRDLELLKKAWNK
jgi:succinate dehydrogenase flavin-adding protein (antitoxin of CptAB toxin-antitoxin module)